MKSLAIVSGGMDSVTLAYWLATQSKAVDILSFDYGQRHVKELKMARLCADRLDAQFDVIDLRGIGSMLYNSLTDDCLNVPDGHYTDRTMRLTVVQNRNAIMLSIAFGIAASRNIDAVAIGVHSGDHAIYPDCRIEFIQAFDKMEREALGEWWNVRLIAPFVDKTKAGIVEIGTKLDVPFVNTWSCYKGGDVHCGSCGTCVERKEAFVNAGVDDPTTYLS